MSVGELGEISDKNNKPCKVFDVIINPSVVEKLKLKKTEPAYDLESMNLFAEILFNYAFQKYKLLLREDYVCLKKTKYKGSYVKFQRVKGTAKPKIQVIDSNKETKENITKNSNSGMKDSFAKDSRQKIIQPDWKLFITFEDGSSEEFDGLNFNEESLGIRIEIELPLLTTGLIRRKIYKS